jgi:hypothetical protein
MGDGQRRKISLRDVEADFSVETEEGVVRIRFEIPGKGIALTAKLAPSDAAKIGQSMIDAAHELVIRGDESR